MVLIRGNPAPQAKDEPTKGSGSMKDIEVLDAIYYMEEELITLEDEYPPINPSMCIVDIMEMIKVPESMVVRIPLDILTPEARQRVDYFINTSFWDVIHMAEDNTTSTWSLRYGKSMQDSMINIFYNSITLEMRSIFVNRDYSKSLIYIQIPMVNEGNTEEIISSINNVINHHSAFISTTKVALVESETGLIQSIVVVLKAMALLIIIIIGVIAFVLFLSEIQKGNKKGKQEPQVFWPEESYPMRGYPPKR